MYLPLNQIGRKDTEKMIIANFSCDILIVVLSLIVATSCFGGNQVAIKSLSNIYVGRFCSPLRYALPLPIMESTKSPPPDCGG